MFPFFLWRFDSILGLGLLPGGFAITLTAHISSGRTPLDELSARHRDPYLKTHNTHNRQTAVPPAGWEPTIPAGERPQTHALDVVASEIVSWAYIFGLNQLLLFTPAVGEMPLIIMKTATFDKLFELCKMMIRWNVESDLTIDHNSL